MIPCRPRVVVMPCTEQLEYEAADYSLYGVSGFKVVGTQYVVVR